MIGKPGKHLKNKKKERKATCKYACNKEMKIFTYIKAILSNNSAIMFDWSLGWRIEHPVNSSWLQRASTIVPSKLSLFQRVLKLLLKIMPSVDVEVDVEDDCEWIVEKAKSQLARNDRPGAKSWILTAQSLFPHRFIVQVGCSARPPWQPYGLHGNLVVECLRDFFTTVHVLNLYIHTWYPVLIYARMAFVIQACNEGNSRYSRCFRLSGFFDNHWLRPSDRHLNKVVYRA